MAEEARNVSARLELENQQGNIRDIGELYSKSPVMLAVWDDVGTFMQTMLTFVQD